MSPNPPSRLTSPRSTPRSACATGRRPPIRRHARACALTEAISATMPLATASREARIAQRVLERRLPLILQYSRRLPLNYLGYILVAFIVWRQGVEFWPWAWLVLTGAVMVYRWRMGLAVERAEPDAQLQYLPRLLRGFDYNEIGRASCRERAEKGEGER